MDTKGIYCDHSVVDSRGGGVRGVHPVSSKNGSNCAKRCRNQAEKILGATLLNLARRSLVLRICAGTYFCSGLSRHCRNHPSLSNIPPQPDTIGLGFWCDKYPFHFFPPSKLTHKPFLAVIIFLLLALYLSI